MKKSIQIILVMCLCFIFKVQAQLTKIDTYSNRVTGLTTDEKAKIDFLFFGSEKRIGINDIITKTNKTDKPARILELNDNEINKLQDENSLNFFQKIRVITIKWGKGKTLNLKADDFKNFLVLKYILIQGYDSLTKEELKAMFSQLSLSEKISDQVEIIYYKINEPS